MSWFSAEENIKSNSLRNGFAIPQILLLGIGIAVGVSGLMSASILSLTGSRISRQELLAKSSTYSGIAKLRALLNDNSRDRLFNYFWIVNNCSESSPNCENITIQTPPNEYWSDDLWCANEENCKGRQKAPLCPPNSDIFWENEKEIVKTFYESDNFIGNTLEDSKREFEQSFKILSSKYIGTEDNGINSILIEGSSLPINSINQKSASNKLRVNIQVNSSISETGFGFLSAGENILDKEESLFLGNLNITPSNNAKGSIIWRMNLENDEECQNFQAFARGENASLPEFGNGGIWIQPLKLPKQPKLKNVRDIGTLICTANNFQKNSNCKLEAGEQSKKTFRIYSLYVKGPGSKFEVKTGDNSKVILQVMGDIDISNEGLFCHRNLDEACGSGKPENLTILFRQKTKSESNKLVCNRDDNDGGIRLKNNITYENITYPIDNDLLPGSSLLIDNTGENPNEKFGAFIYGPQTTFISARQRSNWVQLNNDSFATNNNGLIITSRGSYGYIKNTKNFSTENNMTNLILNSDLKLIPYGSSQNNIEIIGIGKKIGTLPIGSEFNNSVNDVFLIFDNATSNYHLRSFRIVNINNLNNTNLQNSYPRSFAILNTKNSQNDINLGNDLENNSFANSYLSIFDIKVKRLKTNIERNFSGAAWMKNICFDSSGEKNWEFSKDFINNLTAWHGNDFNWGIKNYRGQSIILWDTLREFESD